MDGVDGADVVVLSYGITSRIAEAAVEAARARGVKVGQARLVICWPFPATSVQEMAKTAKAIVFPELNLGQMVLEAERAVAGKIPVIGVPHAGGTVHDPQTILDKILEVAR
jgi:2-oxoglutarate ferredoxin oxidoreductase subunit alpha